MGAGTWAAAIGGALLGAGVAYAVLSRPSSSQPAPSSPNLLPSAGGVCNPGSTPSRDYPGMCVALPAHHAYRWMPGVYVTLRSLGVEPALG